MKKELKLTVNGQPYEIYVNPKTLLVEVLRNNLGLTGTREAARQFLWCLHGNSQWHGS